MQIQIGNIRFISELSLIYFLNLTPQHEPLQGITSNFQCVLQDTSRRYISSTMPVPCLVMAGDADSNWKIIEFSPDYRWFNMSISLPSKTHCRESLQTFRVMYGQYIDVKYQSPSHSIVLLWLEMQIQIENIRFSPNFRNMNLFTTSQGAMLHTCGLEYKSLDTTTR